MQLNDQVVSLKNLHQVIDRYPLTISPDSHLIDATILMNQGKSNKAEIFNTFESLAFSKDRQKSSSYVLVVEEGQLLGIFTLRDILRLTSLGIDFSKKKISEVMTQQLITLKQSDFQDISTVLSILQQYRIHHLPIVDDQGKLLGLITESEILQELDIVRIADVVESIQQYFPQHSRELGTENHNFLECFKTGATFYVNPTYETIFGRSYQSLREHPQSWLEDIQPEDRDRILAETWWNLNNGKHSIIEYRLVKPDKSIRWISARCFTITNEQGEIEYCSGIAEDITERKLAEDSLRESEARLTLALEAGNMGIWDWNQITNHCIWSDHVGSLYGLPKGTLCPSSYQDFLNLIHPEDHEIFTQALNFAIQQKIEFKIEYRAVWPDGSLHWLAGRGKVYYNEQGQPIRMIGTTRDISDRKQKEQQIYEQAALLDIATDAIFVRDFQTEILFWNQGAERIYGWEKDEAVGKNLKDIFSSQTTSPAEATALKTVVKSGNWQGELYKLTKFGQKILVQSRWTLMFDDDGQPKSILIVDTDITEKKQLEDQFLRTQRLESLGTLASGMAHDLNNILTPILVASQLIKGRCDKDKERHPHLLSMIENNAKRGAALVKQVLSFGRGFKGERTILQVKHLLTEIIQIGQQTFTKSIEFSIHIQENLGTICGDSTQIHQVLMNLVVNARDAMPHGGLLTISAENRFIDETYTRMNLDAKVGHYIVITITDTGMGMSSEILDRIFEPFFTTKEVGVGTGLGLSTALGIVKSHYGFVTVSSQVGKGSTFQVFLPSLESPQSPDVEQLEIAPGKKELILIVDDEPQIRDLAKIILENNNYQTLTASNGIEAISVYAQHKQQISVVLMDMMMPEMDGITAIYSLQKINPQVQIIACSGLGTIELLPESSATKVQAVLLKPYTANELLQNLNQVIGNCK